MDCIKCNSYKKEVSHIKDDLEECIKSLLKYDKSNKLANNLLNKYFDISNNILNNTKFYITEIPIRKILFK